MYFVNTLLETDDIITRVKSKHPNIIINSIGPNPPEDGENAYIKIQMIVVPYKERNTGVANAFFKDLLKEARRNKIDIFLTPDDSYSEDDEMNKKQLTAWYKKLGFEKKRSSDFRAQHVLCFYA